MKVKIKGENWKILVLDDKEMNSAHGDIIGCVTWEDRTLTLKRDSLDLNTIMHELWHLHSMYTHQEGTENTFEHYDEIAANMFGNEGESIVKMAKKIYKKLNKND